MGPPVRKKKRYNLLLNLADVPKAPKNIKKKKKVDIKPKAENDNPENVPEEADNLDDEFVATEELKKDTSDPFIIHLKPDLSPELHAALLEKPPKFKKDIVEWPHLGKLIFFSTDVELEKDTEDSKTGKNLLSDNQPFAAPRPLPKCPTDLSFDSLHIKSQIFYNLDKFFTKGGKSFTPVQRELLELVSNYHDVYYPEVSMNNHDEIRQTYCLHAVNHITKIRLRVVNNNEKLKNRTDVPEEFRDQGLVRPKVLILVPFKSFALRIVLDLAYALLGEKGRIHKQTRFIEEFSGDTLIMPDKNPKPPDYLQLFSGNTDDDFKIGVTVTRRSLKLYSDFYSSDIIIASPLGLRVRIGAEGEDHRDYDFLSSIELLIMDQAQVFTMQNWEHVLHIMDHLHLQPKEAHGSDLSRARTWALNGWSKYYMQSLVFSSCPLPEISSLFSSRLLNYAGKVVINNPVMAGSISQVVVHVPQMFYFIKCDSVTDSIDARFQAFKSTILPRFKEGSLNHILVYVPSYFDFVRLRNYCKKEELHFVHICEYTQDKKIVRARSKLFHGQTQFLLYTERFHFFRRILVRGLKHIVFYQLPAFPHFYSEICNFLQDSPKDTDQFKMSIDVLYTKYDVPQLAGVIGTERATRILANPKPVHMFMTEN